MNEEDDDKDEADPQEMADYFARQLTNRLGVRYWKLRGHTPVPCQDVIEFGKWFEEIGKRIVKQDQIGEYWVSTVFLGLDHNWSMKGPPVLFETMVFIGDRTTKVDDTTGPFRYCTWDEAAAEHEVICERLRESG